MANYKNITILGTSHISKESIEKVRKITKESKYDIIALELDSSRIKSLFSEKNTNIVFLIKNLGLKGALFALTASYIQKKLGKYTGIDPGSEMKEAIKIARRQNIKIALIDQPIQITIKKLTSQITRKEKFTFLKEILFFPYYRKKYINFDIKKVPSQRVIEQLVNIIKEQYPTVYRILIEERNKIMAKNLNKLTYLNNNKILAIVGAGHIEGIMGELKSTKN